MALNDELLSINASHSIYVERLAAGLGNKSQPFIDSISEKINARLNKEVGRNLTPARREKLLKDIDAITSSELKDYTALVKAENKEFGGYESAFQAKSVNSLLDNVTTVAASTTVVDKAARNTLIKLGEGSYTTYNQMLDRYWRDNAQHITNIVAQGFVSGTSTREIANRVMNEVDSRLVKTRKQATSIARTGTNHYANQARRAYFAENDVIIGTRRIATVDSGTSQYCRGIDNTVVLKTDSDYRSAFSPFHLSCRTANIPEIDARYAQEDDGGSRPTNFRVDDKLQPKPVSTTSIYYDELRKLPAADQDAVLGKSLGKAYRKMLRDGGTAQEFARLTVNEQLNKAYTLTELKAQDNVLSEILNAQG